MTTPLEAFLAQCEAERERVRAIELAKWPRGKLGAVEATAISLDAQRQMMRYVPDGIEPKELEPHFVRLVSFIESQGRLRDKVRAEHAAAIAAEAAEAEPGRAIARKNAIIGIRKSVTAMVDERERHAEALADAATHSAIEKEHTRHERTMASLALRLSGSLTALSAVA